MKDPQRGMPWQVPVALIVGSQATTMLTHNFALAFLPYYLERGLGVTDPAALNFWLGANAAAVPCVLMLVTPFWGAMGDRVGQRPMMLRALAGSGLMMLLMGLTSEAWQFLLLRVLLGAVGGVSAAALAMVTLVAPRDRISTGLGWSQTGRFVGISAAPAVGGLAGDLFGYRGSHFVAAALCFGLLLVTWRFLPNPSPAGHGGARRGVLDGFRYLGQRRDLLPIMLAIFLCQVGYVIVTPYLPLWIEHLAPGRDRLATISGLVLSAGSLSGAVAGVLVGRIAERRGHVLPLLVGIVGSTFLQVAQPFAQTPEQLFGLRFVQGFAFGALLPLLQSQLAFAVPADRRGVVLGTGSSLFAAANMVGPLIGSSVVVGYGLQAPFVVGAAVMGLAGGAIWWVLRGGSSQRVSAGHST
jgi:MFS transporter, DHA1 family, multidrug resistance protein